MNVLSVTTSVMDEAGMVGGWPTLYLLETLRVPHPFAFFAKGVGISIA